MLGGKPTPLDIISKPCHTAIIISSLELHNNNNKSCLDSPLLSMSVGNQSYPNRLWALSLFTLRL